MLVVAFMAVLMGVLLWLLNDMDKAQDRMLAADNEQRRRNRMLWEQVERDAQACRPRRQGVDHA